MPSRPALNLDGRRIVVAEDARALRFCIREILAPTRATCVEVGNGVELSDALRTGPADLVISDVRMPERSGIDVLRQRRADGDATPFILITGSPGAVSTVGLEPVVMLAKPFTVETLLAAVGEALGAHNRR